MESLRHFLIDVCGVPAEWNMEDVLEEQIKHVRSMVGPDEHVICGLSGGVDSTVAAMLVHKAIGDRLHCLFVDNGLLRQAFIFMEVKPNLFMLAGTHFILMLTKIDIFLGIRRGRGLCQVFKMSCICQLLVLMHRKIFLVSLKV